MRIGEVSKLLGVNSSAIRFYERHGLINSSSINRGENGYRIYSQKDIEEIRLIITFKEFGLELREIKRLLGEQSKSCGDLLSGLDEQIEKCREIERLVKDRIATLLAAKKSCASVCRPSREVRKCSASST